MMPPESWRPSDVQRWLEDQGLYEVWNAFKDEEFDGKALVNMQWEHVLKLKITLGQKIMLDVAIGQLRMEDQKEAKKMDAKKADVAESSKAVSSKAARESSAESTSPRRGRSPGKKSVEVIEPTTKVQPSFVVDERVKVYSRTQKKRMRG